MVLVVSCPRFFSSECKWEVWYGCLVFTFMMKPSWNAFQIPWSTIEPLDILVTNNLDRFVWKMGSNSWEWIFCTLNSYKLLKNNNFFETNVFQNDLHAHHALCHWLIIASPMATVSKYMARYDSVLLCLMQAKVKKNWRTCFKIPFRKNWSRVMVELGIDLHLFRFITKFKSFFFWWHDMLLFLLDDYLCKPFYTHLFFSLPVGNHLRFTLNLFELSNDSLNMI